MSLHTLQSSAFAKYISFDPVYNVLNSFSLLTAEGSLRGLNSWIVRTAEALTPELRRTNRVLFACFRAALTPDVDDQTFPLYLERLRKQDSIVLRNLVLDDLRLRFARRMSFEEPVLAPDRERLLNDVQAYLTCVEYTQIDAPIDSLLQQEAHQILNDAPTFHTLLVSHLETFWEMFAPEWKRVQSSLRWQVEMFKSALDEEASLDETFYMLTGSKLPSDLGRHVDDREEIILVPTWHNGRRVTFWEDNRSIRLFFSEPPNYDVTITMNSISMGRPELLARLGALSDEARLRILELLAQKDEMLAQDIITALELSQSSVSRHLKQLVSLGYLYERRGEGANKTYRLSSFYLERTLRALKQLVSGEESRPAVEIQNENQPQELRRFLDRSGKLNLWPPAKERNKELILNYLASFFEMGCVYNEKEVNETLLLHSTVKDAAALRRALYEYHFMDRARDGSQYWLLVANRVDGLEGING